VLESDVVGSRPFEFIHDAKEQAVHDYSIIVAGADVVKNISANSPITEKAEHAKQGLSTRSVEGGRIRERDELDSRLLELRSLRSMADELDLMALPGHFAGQTHRGWYIAAAIPRHEKHSCHRHSSPEASTDLTILSIRRSVCVRDIARSIRSSFQT
jgi:hypothetical protein